MKTRFQPLYHLYLGALVVALLWAVWAGAAPAGQESSSQLAQVADFASRLLPRASHGFLTFGLDRIPFLNETLLLEQPLWKYLASGIYILLAFYSCKLIDWFVSGHLGKWVARSQNKFDTLLLDLVHSPIKVVSFVILFHVGLRIFAWPAWVEDYLSRGLHLIVAWSLTYMALKAIDLLVNYWQRRPTTEQDRTLNDQIYPVLRKSLKTFTVLVAVLVTSQNLGVNITSVIASLSIGGLALGLAAQDTFANLFGAVAIFIDKPFYIGERIKLDAVDGTVESIGLRSTRVRNLDGYLITIPNKTMGGATITNISRRPHIKTELNFGLTYDTSVEKLRRALTILEEVFRPHPMTHDVLICFNKFADSSLNLQVVHWWRTTDYPAYLRGLQEINFQILERFNAEGLEFAFPTETIHHKQLPAPAPGGSPAVARPDVAGDPARGSGAAV